MTARFSALLFLLAIVPCLSAAADCSALEGWNSGRSGNVVASVCASTDSYLEGYRLGESLFTLEQQRKQLDEQIAADTDPASTGTLRRRQRQLDVDIEAILGVATVRGWPTKVLPENTP